MNEWIDVDSGKLPAKADAYGNSSLVLAVADGAYRLLMYSHYDGGWCDQENDPVTGVTHWMDFKDAQGVKK